MDELKKIIEELKAENSRLRHEAGNARHALGLAMLVNKKLKDENDKLKLECKYLEQQYEGILADQVELVA